MFLIFIIQNKSDMGNSKEFMYRMIRLSSEKIPVRVNYGYKTGIGYIYSTDGKNDKDSTFICALALPDSATNLEVRESDKIEELHLLKRSWVW